MLRFILIGLVLSMAAIYSSHGQEVTTPPAAQPTTQAPQAAPTVAEGPSVKGSTFIGMPVDGKDNKRIGRISNVVVDSNGRIQYVVVSTSGFLGLGSRDLAFRWGELRLDSARASAEAPIAKEQLAEVPQFREDRIHGVQ
jgi:hypothetical protein